MRYTKRLFIFIEHAIEVNRTKEANNRILEEEDRELHDVNGVRALSVLNKLNRRLQSVDSLIQIRNQKHVRP